MVNVRISTEVKARFDEALESEARMQGKRRFTINDMMGILLDVYDIHANIEQGLGRIRDEERT